MNLRKLLPISVLSLGMLIGCGSTTPTEKFPEENSDGVHEVTVTNLDDLKATWYDDGNARAVSVTIKTNGEEGNVPQETAKRNLRLVVEDTSVLKATGMTLSPQVINEATKSTRVAVKFYETVKYFEVTVTHRKTAKEYGAVHAGTLEDPLTNEDALVVAKAQDAEGEFAPVEYYFGGTVGTFYHTPGSRTDKICSWYMTPATEGGEKFEIYSCKKADEEQWTDDDIWEGATFVAHGKLTKYSSQYETSSAILDSVSGTKPAPRQTIAANVAEALAAGKALADGAATWDYYEITGYVVKNSGSNYFLADSKEPATNDKDMFELYSASKYAEQLLKFAKVKVKVTVKNYHGQIENDKIEEVTVLEAGTVWNPSVHTATVAQAITAAKALAASAISEDLYEVTGTVVEVVTEFSTAYNNITFTMGDTETDAEVLKVYRAITTAEIAAKIVAGATVTVKGNLQNYVKAGQPAEYELINVPSVEVKGGDTPDTPTAEKITIAKALEIAGALADKAETTEKYIVEGNIKEITEAFNAKYGNISFTITDGTDDLLVYRCSCSESDSELLVVGYHVTLEGNLKKYNNVLELTNSKFESGETPVTPPESEVELAFVLGEKASAAKVIVGGEEKDAVKIGTTKEAGDVKITAPKGTTKVMFYIASWKDKAATVKVTVTGADADTSKLNPAADEGIQNNSPFTLAGKEDDFLVEINLTNGTGDIEITLDTAESENKRFVVWGLSSN